MSYLVPTAFRARGGVSGPQYLPDLHAQCWQVRSLTFAGFLLAQASQTWAFVTSCKMF